LIGYEQSIVKKIPFLLEIDKQDQALNFAMDSGDPNIIDKVFSDILAKTKGQHPKVLQEVLELVNRIEDAMRHLRNYAKKRKDHGILEQMIKFQQNKQI